MTKDRARKRAARDRAAVTGERYVVARRGAVEAPATESSGGALHDLTHRVPGVPVHVEGGLQSRRRRTTVPAGRNRTHTQPEHGEPQVLIGWQRRIARLFSAK